jgi:hypothetical protein
MHCVMEEPLAGEADPTVAAVRAQPGLLEERPIVDRLIDRSGGLAGGTARIPRVHQAQRSGTKIRLPFAGLVKIALP